jgi:hypothetical protein
MRAQHEYAAAGSWLVFQIALKGHRQVHRTQARSGLGGELVRQSQLFGDLVFDG